MSFTTSSARTMSRTMTTCSGENGGGPWACSKCWLSFPIFPASHHPTTTTSFDYSKEFLRWALTPPGWKAVWHLAIRNSKKGDLIAFISGIPAHMRMREQ